MQKKLLYIFIKLNISFNLLLDFVIVIIKHIIIPYL